MGYDEGFMLIGVIMFGLFTGATVIFFISVSILVGWLVDTVKGREPNEGIVEEEDEPYCVLATDEDFSGTVNGEFRYIGSDDYVKIPHVIKGVEVTSYQFMFNHTKVKKVLSDNPNITDMSYMFNDSQATELDLSSFNTSNVTDMNSMFDGSQATEIRGLENFDTTNVTDMRSMFADSQATKLDLSSFNTSKVTSMFYMFDGSQATVLDLSSFNTSKVTDMTSMFADSQATELDLSRFNTSNVTKMSGMFFKSQATVLDLSSFNTSNVTNMQQMFYNSQVTELDLSSFDTSNVTNMYGMFTNSQTKTVYARTQVDADKFNASRPKPMELLAVVKQ